MRSLIVALVALLTNAATACGQALGEQRPPQDRLYASESAWAPKTALAQEKALADALAALAPQRPGVRDVYVLAAGLWSDNVFINEAGEGAKVLASRFGAEGRTLVLANGALESRGYPAATPAFFNRALGRLGETLDPEEDVLVLFVTSHGAQGRGAIFHEPGRLQGALPPAGLSAALRDAGLRRRIVIVSACFAGEYVTPLADADTIVLTAAAPDRTSFGCEAERSWTWFGDAFINTALRGRSPLLQAFETAKLTIKGWEAREGHKPSLPASHVGAELAKLLPELDRALSRPAAPSATAAAR